MYSKAMGIDFTEVQAKGRWTLQKRAELRKRTQTGDADLPATIEARPDYMENAQVGRTLRYQLSEARATSLLADFGIPWTKRLKDIPHSRRVELAQALRERS